MRIKEVILVFSVILLINLVSADFGYDNPTLPHLTPEAEVTINKTYYNLNSSEWWITDEGTLNNVVDILGSWLTNDLGWINWAKVINGTLALNSSLSNYLLNTGGTIVGEVSYIGADSTYNDNYGIVFGTGYDAEIYYNNANLVINPNAAGSGKVLIGVTGDDDLECANLIVSNRVGIGVSNPSVALHIAGSGLSTIRLSDTGAGNDTQVNAIMQYYRGINTNRVGWAGFGSSSNDNYAITNQIPGGDILLMPTATGNVGIGTTTPQNTLNVIGDGNFTENVTIGDTLKLTNSSTIWNIYVDVNGTLVWEQE